MRQRAIAHKIREALTDTPVILLNGGRQTGKSTLARQFVDTGDFGKYLTLDDSTTLEAASSDPGGFVRGLSEPTIIDEVQRVPELFRAIKAEVDRNRRPGRFFLTGSADIFLVPRLSESLAGRVEIFTLWPFSQGEYEGRADGFIDAAFGETLPAMSGDDGTTPLMDRILTGGFPEAAVRTSQERRQAWFQSYITTLLQRDIRDLANIEGLTSLPRLISLMAARSTGIQNYSEISRTSGLPQTTLKRYMALLQATFLLRELPAWSGNIGKRLVKSPKLLITDTGLMASLTGIGRNRVEVEPNLFGRLLETFALNELIKQRTWSRTLPELFYMRSQTGMEVDCVLKRADGTLVGIEIKSAVSIGKAAFRGLNLLAEAQPDRFHRGIVLYSGDQAVQFSDRMIALPVSALWRMA